MTEATIARWQKQYDKNPTEFYNTDMAYQWARLAIEAVPKLIAEVAELKIRLRVEQQSVEELTVELTRMGDPDFP